MILLEHEAICTFQIGTESVNIQLHLTFSVYLRCSDDDSAAVLKSYEDLIRTLGSGEAVNVITTETPPEGCAISTVSAKCEVHMMLKVCHSPYVQGEVQIALPA